MHTPCVGVTRQDTSGAGRQCTLPSSLTRCHLPLQGRLCERPPPLKASPCRGGGCAVRRRRRGTALSWAFTPAVWQALAAWGLAALPVGVLSAPKAKCPLCRGRCQRCPATPVSPQMLPGGRNRPPYRSGQTAGGTGNVVPMTSIYLSCRPFAADRRAGVHARRLGPCRIAGWRVFWTQSQARPCAGAMSAPPRNPCGGSNAARRAKSPALQTRANGRRNRERRPYDQHLFILSPVRGRS